MARQPTRKKSASAGARARGRGAGGYESPLAWLSARVGRDGKPLITGIQFDAGERLRADFDNAQLSPQITMFWDGMRNPTSGRKAAAPASANSASEYALDARRRFQDAVNVVGDDLARILVEVCCLANGLEAAERRLGWPKRSGKLVLQIALNRLAEHYGMTGAASPSSRRTRTWRARDAKPHCPPAVHDLCRET